MLSIPVELENIKLKKRGGRRTFTPLLVKFSSTRDACDTFVLAICQHTHTTAFMEYSLEAHTTLTKFE